MRQKMAGIMVVVLLLVLCVDSSWATTFSYSKSLQTSAGLPASGAIVKLFRGVRGFSLWGTDTCDATGTFTFSAVPDSFSFYRLEATKWDTNAPWRPMEWLLESKTQLPLAVVDKLFFKYSPPGPLQFNPDRMVGLVLEDCTDEWSLVIADSLAAHNFAASFAINPRFQSLHFDLTGTPADSFTVKALHQMGMRIADHSPTHSVMRGLSLDTYRAVFDSSRADIIRWTGAAPRLFVRPGTINNLALGDTLLTVFPEFYDYAIMGKSSLPYYQSRSPIEFAFSKCELVDFQDSLWHPTYVSKCASRYNLRADFPSTMTLSAIRSGVISALSQELIPILRFHTTDPDHRAALFEVIRWCASANITMVPAEVVGDWVYRGHQPPGFGNLVHDPGMRVDLDGNGQADQQLQALMATKWLGTTPCGLPGFLMWYYISGVTFYGSGLEPGETYELSSWVKSVDRDGSYPDSVAFGQSVSSWSGMGSQGVASRIGLSDSTWHRVSILVTLADTTSGVWSIHWGNPDHMPNDSILVACPCVRKVDINAMSLVPQDPPWNWDTSKMGNMWLSADGDSLYLRRKDGTDGAIPVL